MTPDWTRVPVVVGGGQVTNREEDPAAAPDPFALMVEAARQAADGAGGGGSSGGAERLAGLTHCFMVHSLSLRHGDPAPALARRLGATAAEARLSGMGGSIPQWLVNRAAELVAGGRPSPRPHRRGRGPGHPAAGQEAGRHPGLALERGLARHVAARSSPTSASTRWSRPTGSCRPPPCTRWWNRPWPMAPGRTPPPSGRAVGELMAGFNAVAVANPGSWFPARRSAAEIMTVTPDNRMICYPYPKYVNAVMDVDMGAAVIVTDAATAREWGLGPDEVAYLAGWADAHDIWYLSERPVLERSPALAQCAARVLDSAGLTMDAVDGLDLYACFPSSVEVARDSFGIGRRRSPAPHPDRRPAVPRGPGEQLRDPRHRQRADVAAAGGGRRRSGARQRLLPDQALRWGSTHAGPPTTAPLPPDGLQDSIDAAATPLPVEASAPAGSGLGTVVAYTVPFDREGAPAAALAVVDMDGVRTVACGDEALTAAFMAGRRRGGAVVAQPGGRHQHHCRGA